ncbi:hypothetical protein LCGC14_2084590 [marine sediment metagenome]|uniref:Cation/H+ exchanger domain-containing protein n=1 Tax=marine sediment metagenome TaxID=412755 RepID=A0A0F9F1V0_9ZZZZ
MAISLALIIFLGLICDYLLGKIRLPGLVGMLLVGVAAGPYVLDLLDPAILDVSADFRLMARSAGTWLSVQGAGFNRYEQMFCVVAYIPKATVQAAIGPNRLRPEFRGAR